jgi:tetratricopeptide (TPR) repeat protein
MEHKQNPTDAELDLFKVLAVKIPKMMSAQVEEHLEFQKGKIISMKFFNEKSRTKSHGISEKIYLSIFGRYCAFGFRVVVAIVVLTILGGIFRFQSLAADSLPSQLVARAPEGSDDDQVESSRDGTQSSSPNPADTNAPLVVHVSDDYIEQAIMEIRAGRPRAALKLSEKGLAANPDSAIALAVLGLSQLGCGQWPEAEVWLKQALALDSTLPEAHLGLAEIAYGRMQCDLAIAHSNKAIASHQFKAEAYSVQADCLEEMNLHDQASQAMREAYKWSDHLPEYHRKNIQNWSEIYSSYEGRDLYEIPDDFRSTVIPFKNYLGFALLPVTADGQDLDSVLLDTGFGGSLMISAKDAEKMGLVFSGEHITRTFLGELVLRIALVKSVRLGDLVVHNVPAYVSDDVPGGFGGLIGWQLLKHFNFSIDLTSSQFTIFNREYPNLQKDIFSKDRYLDRIPFLYGPSIRVNACFGDKGPGFFIFDTGARYPSLHVDPSNDTSVVGSESRTSIRIGHLVFDNAKFLYYDLSSIHEIGRYYFDGVIGISIFQNSVLHFNPGESALYLECGLTD